MRHAALVGVGQRPLKAYCAIETALCFHARPCSDVLALRPLTSSRLVRVRTRQGTTVLSLSGEGAERVRRTALGGVGQCPMETHCAGETTLSFYARPAPTC